MAPKKKKKPAYNPSRGFATVSLPSKSKLNQDVSETVLDTPIVGTAKDSASNGQHAKKGKDASPEALAVQDMSPEELEEHLEDAELQSILDVHGARSKREASRQVTRLEAERRLHRAQALDLDTTDWLPADLVKQIIELTNSQGLTTVTDRNTFLRSETKRTADVTDLSIKLWTLHQTLRSLRMPQVEDALNNIVDMVPAAQSASLSISKDSIWGPTESFDWLACHVALDRLPRYGPSRRVSSEGVDEGAEEALMEASHFLEENHLPSARCGAKSSTSGASYGASSSQRDNTPSSSIDPSPLTTPISSEDDEEIDPDDLVAKYVDTQSALLRAENRELDHQLPVQEASVASHTARLRRTLEKITRDVLFDQHEADRMWIHERRYIQRSLPKRPWKSFRTKQGREHQPAPDQTAASLIDLKGPISQMSDEEEDNVLGAMFDAPLDGGEQDGDPSKPVVNEVTQLIDFGKWTGIGPRRVLEDTCRARDSACTITYQQLPATSYSHRSSLQIRWSKPQKYDPFAVSVVPENLSSKFAPPFVVISMKSISTSSAQQSEAYISTVSYFAIFSSTANEEKPFLRLPDIWRDLFKELSRQKQALIDKEDKTALKLIRSIIERSPQTAGARSLAVLPATASALNGTDHAAQSLHNVSPKNPEERFESIWAAKASTLAYRRMLGSRSHLPIWDYKGQIIQNVETQQITILCAETGAGKSTQVPAYILESELSAGRNCRILVTQPRRISATSVARRVSAELGESKHDIGSLRSLVGYAIRLESKTSSTTRITYATTGVLLRMLEHSPDLVHVSHLILDEIHERTMDLDLLFIAIKHLTKRRPDLRVVLMSATVEAQKFSTYFGGISVLYIRGRTFPVIVKYLEDAVEATNITARSKSKQNTIEESEEDPYDNDRISKTRSVAIGLESYSAETRKILASFDEYSLDYDLLTNLAAFIATSEQYHEYSRAILVFMPGIAEIRRLHRTIMSHPTFLRGWRIDLLHSSFSNEDLDQAFLPPPQGMRKIVIATNIAETGITIPDVTAVIDTCKEKIMRFDERRQLSKLTESFISRSSCRQRRGRAARVQKGLCFHLVTRYRLENLMSEHHVPEMLRLSLQDAVLRVKVWDLGEIDQTLAEAPDPPSAKNVRRAIEAMKDVKALTASEDLTPLGRQLARLPLDVWLAKLIILGISFRCLDAAVTIASLLSSKSPFVVSPDWPDPRAETARLSFARNSCTSDLLLMYNAYLAWRRASVIGKGIEFCKKSYLNEHALVQLEEQKIRLLISLGDAGLLCLDGTEKQALIRARSGRDPNSFFDVPCAYNTNDRESTISSLIAMAFYPKLLVRDANGWRNVSTNQHVSLAPTSINKFLSNGAKTKSPRWLSFHQAMQTKSGNLSVFETSAVPEAAIVILLGEAEFRLYAGVIAIDGNKVRFRVKDWKTMIALKILRARVLELLAHSFRHPNRMLSEDQERWLDIWQQVMNPSPKKGAGADGAGE